MGSAAGIVRLVEREAHVARRLWRSTVVHSVVNPLLFLLGLGVGLGGLVDERAGAVEGLSYLHFVAPGLLAATAMQMGSAGSLWPIMSGTRWMRYFHGMVATPISPADVHLGYVVWVALRAAAASAVFIVVAALCGGVPSAWGVLGILGAVLTAAAFAAPLSAYAATQQTDVTFAVIMRLGVTPMFLFSGTFFPLAQLPAVLRPVAWVSPLWHGVELCRAATTGGGLPLRSFVVHLGVLAAYIAAGLWWGARTFRKNLAA